jgi:hypothetical protein
MEDFVTKHPDRYVITGLIAKDSEALRVRKGDRVWLYWSPEGGGWWQWGPEGWAYRFEAKSGHQYDDAIVSAKGVGPYYNVPDPSTIETVAVPAIVTVS